MSDKASSEVKLSQKWNGCIENTLVKTGFGMIGAGLASMVLFRGGVARGLTTGFGAGVGAGIGWSDCRMSFENPQHVRLSKFPTQLSAPQFSLPSFAKSDAPAKPAAAAAPKADKPAAAEHAVAEKPHADKPAAEHAAPAHADKADAGHHGEKPAEKADKH